MSCFPTKNIQEQAKRRFSNAKHPTASDAQPFQRDATGVSEANAGGVAFFGSFASFFHTHRTL
jgi:hypothetical protein